jgi:hypothetical protein
MQPKTSDARSDESQEVRYDYRHLYKYDQDLARTDKLAALFGLAVSSYAT